MCYYLVYSELTFILTCNHKLIVAVKEQILLILGRFYVGIFCSLINVDTRLE